jgi:glutamyl-tRNA reductase
VSLAVASRTRERAEELAQRVRGRAVGFDDFPEELLGADIVVCCTSAPRVLITPELVRRAVGGHHRRPLFLVDLAVPRDVDPAVGALEDVYLYDIDDLEALVHDNEARRRCELPRVEEIIEREAQDFLLWLNSLEAVPVMLAIREKAESIREEELQGLFDRLPHLTARDRKALHLTTKRLVRRLLGAPLDSVRARAGGEDAQEYLSLVQDLFDVRREPADCDLPPPEEEEGGG